ncbi:hypothetical protein MCAG_02481 [Micromonospora sp. ATCC 39149]|nr:hypothetical protein MCAG_02481 [Micromonospora sp. ATCC 39149]
MPTPPGTSWPPWPRQLRTGASSPDTPSPTATAPTARSWSPAPATAPGGWTSRAGRWAVRRTVSLAATADGLFQCGLPSAGRPEPASCVRLGDPTDAVPRRLDPRVQHPFTDWLEVLTDRRAPLAVSPARPPQGASGSCYSVDTTSASLNAPLDVGIYCYAPDGTPTAVRTTAGTLTLAGPAGPGPATVALPGPVTDGEPLGVAAPEPEPKPDESAPTGAATP